MKTRKTYFGSLVRIDYRGSGVDKTLVVQRFNPLADSWLDVKSFDESFDFAYTDSRLYASALAYELRRGANA
jgi:hypothetical protein